MWQNIVQGTVRLTSPSATHLCVWILKYYTLLFSVWAVTHEHLKERSLFGLPHLPPGVNPSEYYHLIASHRNPYGDLFMPTAAAAAHLPDYMSPVDSKLHTLSAALTSILHPYCKRSNVWDVLFVQKCFLLIHMWRDSYK